MDVHFQRGQLVTADRLNAVAGLASEANIRSASWNAYNNGDSLVLRPPRRDDAIPATRCSRSFADRVYVGRVIASYGHTVQVLLPNGTTCEVSVLNSTSQTRFEKNQNILVHGIQLASVGGTYEDP